MNTRIGVGSFERFSKFLKDAGFPKDVLATFYALLMSNDMGERQIDLVTLQRAGIQITFVNNVYTVIWANKSLKVEVRDKEFIFLTPDPMTTVEIAAERRIIIEVLSRGLYYSTVHNAITLMELNALQEVSFVTINNLRVVLKPGKATVGLFNENVKEPNLALAQIEQAARELGVLRT